MSQTEKPEDQPDPGTMSLEDKLLLIEREIHTLHQCCLSKGYTPLQIERFADPVWQSLRVGRKQRWISFGWKAALVVAAFAALFAYDPAYRLMCAYGRRATIQMLPYWDWTHYYDQECLIENPFFKGNELTEEDCEVCETIEEIARLSNVSHSEMANYLKQDTPVIVTDAMEGWSAIEKFNIHFLNELYNTEEVLKIISPCMFASNVRAKYSTVRAILQKASKGEVTKWYAHWENCDKPAAKVLRQFYQRPYFVPPMVEMGESNWVLIASNYKAKRPKPVDVAMPMGIFAQLKGTNKFEITPRAPCNETCSTLYVTLHPGEICLTVQLKLGHKRHVMGNLSFMTALPTEIVVTTDLMWYVDYLPLGDPETIAIVVGGYFD